MRAILGLALLLALLAVGVVRAQRDAEGGSLLLGWLAPAAVPAGAGAAAEPAVEPLAAPDAEPGQRAPADATSSASEVPTAVLAAGELSVLEPDAPEPMLRYVDADGSLHMVRGRSRVPERYRQTAVEVGRGNVNVASIPAPSAAAFRDWQPESAAQRVVLFSASWCGACQRAKRFLDERGVSYRERDIDTDATARDEVQRVLGRVAIPLLDVDGRYISGFRPDVYQRALGTG